MEKHEYCSTVPRTFVQDCRSTGVVHGPGESMFCIGPPVHVHINFMKSQKANSLENVELGKH